MGMIDWNYQRRIMIIFIIILSPFFPLILDVFMRTEIDVGFFFFFLDVGFLI
jgi:hypothetical protein